MQRVGSHIVVGEHDITKELKGALHHAFAGGHTLSQEDFLATYESFLADFNSADANKDGQLDQKEWAVDGHNAGDFDMWDMNKDGAVDAAEYDSMRKTEKLLGKLDADGDGKISREEWIAKYGNADGFDAYDLDGDGVIDADEFRKCKAGDFAFEKMKDELDADGDGKISREEWIAAYGSDVGFDMYDLDGDGVIDANEFRLVNLAKIDFTRMDLDGDGVISREEWIAKYGSDEGFDEIAGEDGKIDLGEMIQAETTGSLSKESQIARRENVRLATEHAVPCSPSQAACSRYKSVRVVNRDPAMHHISRHTTRPINWLRPEPSHNQFPPSSSYKQRQPRGGTFQPSYPRYRANAASSMAGQNHGWTGRTSVPAPPALSTSHLLDGSQWHHGGVQHQQYRDSAELVQQMRQVHTAPRAPTPFWELQ